MPRTRLLEHWGQTRYISWHLLAMKPEDRTIDRSISIITFAYCRRLARPLDAIDVMSMAMAKDMAKCPCGTSAPVSGAIWDHLTSLMRARHVYALLSLKCPAIRYKLENLNCQIQYLTDKRYKYAHRWITLWSFCCWFLSNRISMPISVSSVWLCFVAWYVLELQNFRFLEFIN